MSNERKQSKLDELLRELCPDGVEYKELQEILKIKNGSDYKAYSEGDIPVYGSGGIMTYIDRYVYNKPSVLIPRKGSIDKLYYVDTPFWNVDTIFYTEINTDLAMPRYVYHCLLREHLEQYNTAGGVPTLTQKVLNKVQIPLPPLPVQREIVRILDKFTELTEALIAELTARKKQYEFYRNKLLTFDDVRGGATSDVAWKTLGEVCYISAGGDAPKDSMSKQKTEKYSVPIISNGIGENALYGYTDAAKIEEPAVTVAARGTIGYAEYREYPFYPIIRLLTAIPKDTTVVNTKYLYYCLQGKQYSVPMGGIPQLTAPELKKVEIPIPSIQVQKRIVNVLDNFDAICSDLKIGLPAEIEARKKQYEFYREKLLAFHEISN